MMTSRRTTVLDRVSDALVIRQRRLGLLRHVTPTADTRAAFALVASDYSEDDEMHQAAAAAGTAVRLPDDLPTEHHSPLADAVWLYAQEARSGLWEARSRRSARVARQLVRIAILLTERPRRDPSASWDPTRRASR